MPEFSATNADHRQLFEQTDADLRLRGMSDEDIEALRKVQYSAPPATSVEEARRLARTEARSSRREEAKQAE